MLWKTKCSFLVVQRKLNEQTELNIWSDLHCRTQASQTFANQGIQNIKKGLKNIFLYIFLSIIMGFKFQVFASWKRV